MKQIRSVSTLTDKALNEYLSQQKPDKLEPLWEGKPLHDMDHWQTKKVDDINKFQ